VALIFTGQKTPRITALHIGLTACAVVWMVALYLVDSHKQRHLVNKTAPIRLTEKLAKFGSFIPIQLVLVLLKQYKKKLKKRTNSLKDGLQGPANYPLNGNSNF
jgi:uncharacterized membrane protein